MPKFVGAGALWPRGLTLIELTVVLGIIVLLAAVVIPALQYARETARRAQCRNNCLEIGRALANYADAMTVFPTAHIVASSADTCAPLGVSGNNNMAFVRAPWTIQIEPWLADSPIYNEFNFQPGFMGRMDLTNGISDLTTGYNVTFGQTTVPALRGQWSESRVGSSYRCPSNPAFATDRYISCYYACMGGGGGGWQGSAINAAPPVNMTNSTAPPNPLAPCFNSNPANPCCPSAEAKTGAAPKGPPPNERLAWNNGIMHLNSSTTLKSITDGAANTVIAGETLYVGLIRNYSPASGPGKTIFGTPKCGAWMWSSSVQNCSTKRGGTDGFVLFNTAATWCPINQCWFDGTFQQCKSRGGATGYSQIMAGFSSWHAGGAHHIFADGSVRFINQTVDLATYQTLGCKDDGLGKKVNEP